MWDVTKKKWATSGLIGIWRCWTEQERKQDRYEYEYDSETNSATRVGFIYEKRGSCMKDANVDGQLHHEIYTKPGGLLPSYATYLKHPVFRRFNFPTTVGPGSPAVQQDGAGGHGVGGEWHRKIGRAAAACKPPIRHYTQEPNSAAFNACDLGLWPILLTGVKRGMVDKPRTCDALWACLEKVFWEIDPDKLDNIFHLKTVCIIQVHKAKGDNFSKEAHSGYRACKRQLGGKPPTWAQLRKHPRGKQTICLGL